MPHPLRAEDPSGVLVNFRVTTEERERLKLAARANFQTLSDFARDVLTNAASETLDDEQDAAKIQP